MDKVGDTQNGESHMNHRRMHDGAHLYIPYHIQLQMAGCDLSVKYLEKLDETCVEFPHTHVSHEIYYVLSGQLVMQVGGQEHLLQPNQFILLPPGVRHSMVYNPDEPKEYVVIVYAMHRNSELAAHKNQPGPAFISRVEKALAGQNHVIAQDDSGCRDILTGIQKESQLKAPGWQLILEDYCREFFVKLMRHLLSATPVSATPVSATSGSTTPQQDGGQANLAVEITKYMHEHYHEDITLEDVAKAFYITPRHVTRIFGDYFGTSFRKTLSIYRLNYAKNYLCFTDKSVEDIASLVGISAVQTLYRLFKENEGMTISEYRKFHHKAL